MITGSYCTKEVEKKEMNKNNITSSINGEINSDFIPSNKKVIYIYLPHFLSASMINRSSYLYKEGCN